MTLCRALVRWGLLAALLSAVALFGSSSEAKPRQRPPRAREVEEPNPFLPIAQWPLPASAPPQTPPATLPPRQPLPPPGTPSALPQPAPARGAAVYKPVGRPVDLSAAADPAKAVAGTWTVRAGELSAARGGGHKRIALGPPPSAAYMWDLTFQRAEGRKEFCLLFPVAGQPAQVWLGGMSGQHSSIEGPRDPAAHNQQPLIKNNADQRLRLVVIPNGDQCYVEVLLDGASYLKYQGPISALRVHRPYALPDGTQLALMAHSDSSLTFTQMKVYAMAAQ